jgi:type-F conjugative transfer system pilin assembly protein TrbC
MGQSHISDQARRQRVDAAAIKAEQDSHAQRNSAMDQAARAAQPARVYIPDSPAAPATPAGVVDPDRIARQFSDIKGPEKREEETNELILFVSLSMPTGSLERAARDVKKTSGMLVMRGASRGVGPGKWVESIADMKPMTDNGGEVFLHPDMFDRYNIKKVPALVIAPDAQAGCTEDACREFAVIYGDVSLEYALDQLTERKDSIGRIARERLALLGKR